MVRLNSASIYYPGELGTNYIFGRLFRQNHRSVIRIPISCLLRDFGATSRLAHNYAVDAEDRNGRLSG